MTRSFFDKQSESSKTKARIVQEYFDAWSKIVSSAAKGRYGDKIAYVDLYAGPGRYEDGAASTPLLVIQKALESDKISRSLVAIFNDKDEDHSRTLKTELDKIPGIEKLRYPPTVYHEAVTDDTAKRFESIRSSPTLTFLDPFGYKGLTLRLINNLVNSWGCDCIFFFNFNRVRIGITNPLIASHMNALFGEKRADELRKVVDKKLLKKKEFMIIHSLSDALKEGAKKFVLPFEFRDERNHLTHYLVFVTKHIKGLEVMKDIMAKHSSSYSQGVPSFSYSIFETERPYLLEMDFRLDQLSGDLLKFFAGKTISMIEIYRHHHVGRLYIKKNYKEALSNLADSGKVDTIDPSGRSRSKGKFPDHTIVTFPKINSEV